MGFTPSDKPTMKKCKKGLWSPDEDQKLRNYVINYGHGCWSSVPINAGLQRSGKSCRLRWINYLRPGLKRGAFSAEEEETIFTLHQILGNKWSQMAHHLPGRTDNEIKNHWHSHLKKRISKTLETQVSSPSPCKNEYTNKTVEGSEVSYSSPATTDESIVLQTQQSMANQNCNLPKVLFAEWLSLDQFHDANTSSAGSATSALSKYSVEESEDSLVQDLFFDEGLFAGQVLHPAQQSNGIIPMDNDMFQSSFVDHASMIDYNFPSEFNVDCHYMYM